MKFFLISDNTDTCMGMRLAGVDGVVVHERGQVADELEKAMADKENAVILITEKLVKLCRDEVYRLKLTCSRPLIVEIPDRHGTLEVSSTISGYVNEAIGIKM